jgi:hypothetical protein
MTAAPPAPLTPPEIAAMIRGFSDHARFCSHLKIRNKDGITVPYGVSPAGGKLNRSIRQQEQAALPVRQVVLKASQVFMTSSASAEIFRRVPFFPGRRCLMVADSQAHVDLIFQYFDQYVKSYTENPYGVEWNSAILLPELTAEKHASGAQTYQWANGSSILVGTANNPDIGRSAPYNWALLSEAAFYRDMPALMTGLMQRVPQSPDSGVIVESTPNGMGGGFYDLCQLAMDPTRRSGWAFVFFGYHEHPEYRAAPKALGYADLAAFQKSLSRAEWEEQQKYNLTLEQLAWRRRQIETACEGRLERFQREFPGNPQEAFPVSGRSIFDMGVLAKMPVIDTAPAGRLDVFEVGPEKKVQFLPSSDGRGELTVYVPPVKGRNYCIGIDHAEGIDPGAKTGSSDPDYCSASVLDAATGEQVCKLRQRYEPRPWAQRVYWLGAWYNWAFLTPEQKAVGKAVIGHLLELGYPTYLIYSAQRDPSDRRPALLQELGYDTNAVSRPMLVSALDTAIRERAIQIHDPVTIAECQQFVRKPNGREEGIKHDDDVFGLALAVIGLGSARRAFAYRDALLKDAEKLANAKGVRYGGRDEDDD